MVGAFRGVLLVRIKSYCPTRTELPYLDIHNTTRPLPPQGKGSLSGQTFLFLPFSTF